MKGSLLGAIIGDICGSTREGLRASRFTTRLKLFPGNSKVTDDTVLTIAIAEWLMNQDSMTAKDALLKWGRLFPHAGYGRGFKYFIKTGESYVSSHNGAAMRVSGVALYASSMEECLELASLSAAPTHNTKEGTEGAQAIALATWMAAHDYSKNDIRQEIETRFGYDLGQEIQSFRDTNIAIRDGKIPKSGSIAEAAVTVPQALTAFMVSTDFENAIKTAVSIGGDSDTLAAMCGSVASAYYGIPDEIVKEVLVYLPAEMIDVINRFEGTNLKPTGIVPPNAHRWTANEYLVYGSNREGTAFEKGHDETVGGRFNRHPLKPYPIHTIGCTLEEVSSQVNELLDYAKAHPEKRFHLTNLGCDKAGFSIEQIAPLFAVRPGNVLVTKEM